MEEGGTIPRCLEPPWKLDEASTLETSTALH